MLRYARSFSLFETSPLLVAMGLGQSRQSLDLARFDGKFAEFMRDGKKVDVEVLITLFTDSLEVEYEIPDWKIAAVFAGAKAWGVPITETLEGDWGRILRVCSILPIEGEELYAPITDLCDTLDTWEMILKGWDRAESARKFAMESWVGEETTVYDQVRDRLSQVAEQEWAYPSWFCFRARNIFYGYNPRPIFPRDIIYTVEESDTYGNPPSEEETEEEEE